MPRFPFAVFVAVLALACRGAEESGAESAPVGDSLTDSLADSAEIARLPVLEGVAPFPPVDEGASDPSFARFRADLLRAVEQRDTSAVLAIVAPEIRNTFGGDDGVDSFREIWSLRDADSALWPTLETVLRHGGTFSASDTDTLFMAPWVFAAWPNEIDAFEHVATLTDDAVVRAAPDSAARALGVVPHRIVAFRWNEPGREGWTPVALPDGRNGWIASRDVYSPVDYRAVFAKQAGSWRMITLIAGD